MNQGENHMKKINVAYEYAKVRYAELGIDTDVAIAKLKEVPLAVHCWQGDDVTGFDHDGPLTVNEATRNILAQMYNL